MRTLDRTLRTIFKDQPIFISDSAATIDWLRGFGCEGVTFDDAKAGAFTSPPAAVICSSSPDAIPDRSYFDEHLADTATLFLPFNAFDPSDAAIRYGFDLLSRLDVAAQVDGVISLVRMLDSDVETIGIGSAGADAVLRLSDNIRILNAKTEVDIARGEWASIATYLEVTLVPASGAIRLDERALGFSLEGTLSVDGCAVAQHRFFPSRVGPLAARAWAVIQETRHNGGFPLRLTIEHTHLVSVTTAHGEEILPRLLECVDPGEGTIIREVAFATGTVPKDALDLSINSQFNEAAGGVHVAMGTGLRGAHIDFICVDAQLRTD